jgi:glycosyltransferase involved in cell wall biosynthesis
MLGTRYVLVVYDIYPDVMVRMGMIRQGGLIDRLLRRVSRAGLLGADCTITLGGEMAEVLKGHLRPGDRAEIRVIHNWADTGVIAPSPRAGNPFALRHGLADKFVVMYSGAFGATHGVETIVEAAELCRDLDEVRFVLIGGGTQYEHIRDLVAKKSLPNLLLLPFQPLEDLPHTLGAADCLVVTLGGDYAGLSVPSKTYYALAAGAAVLACCEPRAELARIVGEHECGLVCAPNDPAALAKAIRRLYAEPEACRAMGQRSRQAAMTHYDRKTQTAAYAKLLTNRSA